MQPSCSSAFVVPILYNFAERCQKALVLAGFGGNGVKKSSGALYQKLPDDMVDTNRFEPLTFWSVVVLKSLVFSILVHYILISPANQAVILAIRSYPLLSFDKAVHEIS